MDENRGEGVSQKTLPFNNLFLNSGFVSGFNQWWMYGVTICITVLCYLLAPAITAWPLLVHATAHGIDPRQLAEDPNRLFNAEFMGVDKNLVLAAMLGIFVIAAAGFVFAIRTVHKKSLTSVLTGFEKFRFGRFWFAFGLWGALVIIKVICSYFANPSDFSFNFNATGFIISTLMMFVFMPVQTGFEEVFFRGYLMQGFGQIFKNGITPLIITSLLFGAVHMSNPEAKEYGWAIMLVYYVLFALFAGSFTLLDEGLELAFGIHFANNFISSFMLSVPGSTITTYSIFEGKDEHPGTEIFILLGMALLCFFVFRYKYRWKNLNLILK